MKNRKFHRNDTSGGRKIHQIDTSDSESDDELFLGMLTLDVNTVDADDKWSAELNVNEKPVMFQLDTGAKCNVITRETYNALDTAAPLSKPDAPLMSYTGHKIHTEGTAILPVQHNSKNYQLIFYVEYVKSPNILGERSCSDMNLVQRVQSVTQQHAKSENLDNILSQPEYDELLKELGCLPGEHSIKLNKSVTPTVQTPRKIPVALRDKVRDELTRMESLGVIVKQDEPTPWVNSMVVVNKGSKVRRKNGSKEYNLKLNRGKCEIKRTEVKYVGHLLTAEGVKPDPEKIRAVETMKKPENKQELLTFLGFIQYLRKFSLRRNKTMRK